MKKKDRLSEIANYFDYYDSNLYTWEIIPKKKSLFTSIIVVIAQSVMVPAIFFGLFYLIGMFLPVVAFWGALIFGIILFITWFLLIFGKGKLGTENIANFGGVSIGIALVGILGFLIYSPESFFKGGFTGDVDSNTQWLVYVGELFLKVITLDFIEIFEIKISSIQPDSNTASFLIFVFNTVLSLGIVDGAIRTFGIGRNVEVFLGTIRDLYERLSSMVGEHGLEFRKIGVVQDVTDTKQFVAMDFLDTFGKEFDQELE